MMNNCHGFLDRKVWIGIDTLCARVYDEKNDKRKPMRVASSLKTLKKRHKDCRLIRRKGRVYVINKTNPRMKARQG